MADARDNLQETTRTVSINTEENEDKDGNFQEQRQRSSERQRPIRSIPSSKKRKGIAQSSADRKDCRFYLAGRCRYGSTCHDYHSTHKKAPVCKFFQTGNCDLGSTCNFYHTKDKSSNRRDTRLRPDERNDCCMYFQNGTCRYGTRCHYKHHTHIPQATNPDRRRSESELRFDERIQRRYESESEFRPVKRSKAIPDSRVRDPRKPFEDISQRGHEELGLEEEKKEQIERQSRETQDIHQNGRHREGTEEQRREAHAILREQMSRGIYSSELIDLIVTGFWQAKKEESEKQMREAQGILQEQRQKDSIERQSREAQEQQIIRELPENRNVESSNQHKMQKQRQRDIERLSRKSSPERSNPPQSDLYH